MGLIHVLIALPLCDNRYRSHIHRTITKNKAGSKSAISINLVFTSMPVKSVVQSINHLIYYPKSRNQPDSAFTFGG